MSTSKPASPLSAVPAAIACSWHPGENGLAAALLSDGSIILLRPADGAVLGPLLSPRVPTPGAGRPPANIPSEESQATALAFISATAPTGLLVGFDNGTVRELGLPDTAPASVSGRMLLAARRSAAVSVLIAHPAARSLLLGDVDGNVTVHAREAGTLLATMTPVLSVEVPVERTTQVRLSGCRLQALVVTDAAVAVTDDAGRLHVLDSRTLTAAAPPRTLHADNTPGTALIYGEKVVVAAASSGTVSATSVSTGATLWVSCPGATGTGSVGAAALMCLAMAPDGELLACGDALGSIFICNTPDGRILQHMRGHAGAVRDLCFSADGASVWSASNDATVRVWDLATNSGQQAMACPGRVTALALNAPGTRLAIGGGLGFVQVMDTLVPVGTVQLDLVGHTRAVKTIAWDPAGDRLASGGEDCAVRVWDAASGALLLHLDTLRDWVVGCAFAPQTGSLYACARDGHVLRWRLASGALDDCRVIDHAGAVVRCRATPDGQRVMVLDGRKVRLVSANGGDGVVASYQPPRQGQSGGTTENG